jgi:general secretion pathway protein N
MRVDDAGARTWLLAAVAAWAVLAWLLAVFGMGGRIEPLADDPSLVKPVPALPAGSVSRIGPIAQYAEIGARPLFSTDRRPKPFSLKGDADGTDAGKEFDYQLTSVLITPNLQMAILQPPDGSESARVKLGEAPEKHPAWRLSEVNARSAVFDGPSGQRTLDLRVFDGIGGQPPTAIGRNGQPPAQAVPITPPVDGNGNGISPAPITTPSRPMPTAPVPPGTIKPSAAAPATSTPPMTEQAQMEAIRQRIQARRAQLRQQSQPTQPPAKGQ